MKFSSCSYDHLTLHLEGRKKERKKERKADIALHGNPVFELRLTPAMQAGTRFTYPGGMEG